MAERYVEVNYSPTDGLTLRFRPLSLSLIPEPTRQHLRAANKELLLALRSIVDETIERMETSEQQRSTRGPRRVHVKDEGEETTEA